MPRFGLRVVVMNLAVVTCSIAATRVDAQTPNGTDQPVRGISVTSEVLADLPLGSTLDSLLDTSVPGVISERVDAGTLMPGRALRIGSGTSWTGTRFRIGDLDITDAIVGGRPLLQPNIFAWERIDVTTGGMPLDLSAPGVAVTLTPRRPAASWSRQVEFFAAGPDLLSRTALTTPPAIQRLQTWRAANLLFSGPLVSQRLSVLVGASWTNGAGYERDDPTRISGNATSLFTHLVFTPTPRDEIRLFQWTGRARSRFDNRIAFGQPSAAEYETSVHVQATWERRAPATDWSWRGFAGLTAHEQTTDLLPQSTMIMDRLRDGPVPELLAPLGTDRLWSFGVIAKPAVGPSTRLHDLQLGIVLSTASAHVRAPFTGRIGELVNGIPARIWNYSAPGGTSDWHESTVSMFAGDRIMILPRVTLDAGLRLEIVHGSAAANATSVDWRNWFPQAGIRWAVIDQLLLTAFMKFTRSGYHLPLRDLAYGDSSAPVADVFRWNAALANDPQMRDVGPLVERVGPGTGGDARFSAIDPGLERPIVNEMVLGFELRPSHTFVRIAGFARREHQLIGLVDTGVPLSSYSTSLINDPGDDKYSTQQLPVYNRAPAAFGADRYLLTNPSENETTLVGVEVTAQARLERLFVAAGATASRSEGLSASRGFSAIENDEGIVGELFTDPNAHTNARGRLFTERGYTITTSGVYQFPSNIRLGVIGRYQDGQHFARLVLVPNLNQGAEAIRAFANGHTRFTFTLTLDARLQKTFAIGTRRVTALLDGYNLLNTATEIEEVSVTGPSSRVTAAVQPPRSLHAGLRIAF